MAAPHFLVANGSGAELGGIALATAHKCHPVCSLCLVPPCLASKTYPEQPPMKNLRVGGDREAHIKNICDLYCLLDGKKQAAHRLAGWEPPQKAPQQQSRQCHQLHTPNL